MENQSANLSKPSAHLPWLVVSVVLLIIYLGFFHLCLGASYGMCIAYGFGSWLLWTVVCYVRRTVFLSKFEHGIHQLVGIDFLLEGFSPLHEGLGFYYCAAGFWAVFVAYRITMTIRNSRATGGLEPPVEDVVSNSMNG